MSSGACHFVRRRPDRQQIAADFTTRSPHLSLQAAGLARSRGTDVAPPPNMINPEKLTVKAGEALNEAVNLARRNGNPVLYDLHLLAALLEQDESIVVPVLQKLGASV